MIVPQLVSERANKGGFPNPWLSCNQNVVHSRGAIVSQVSFGEYLYLILRKSRDDGTRLKKPGVFPFETRDLPSSGKTLEMAEYTPVLMGKG